MEKSLEVTQLRQELNEKENAIQRLREKNDALELANSTLRRRVESLEGIEPAPRKLETPWDQGPDISDDDMIHRR